MQQVSHKQSLYRIFFAIILLLSTLPIFSQGVGQYPVQVSTVVLPNPPMYLSAYSGVETDKLSVTLLNRDTQQSSLQVKLRMRIYCSQGQEISSRAESLYTPITLEGGIPLRLSMSDLAAYFRTENLRIAGSLPQGKLPVGHTRFCFEVLEYYTGRLLSSQGCGSAFIVLQTPPLLQQPSHGSLLTDDPTGGILFRWSPQHSVGLERVQYEFILKEMFDTQQSAELGFAHGVEVYRTHTTATSLLYGMMQPPLIAGKRYVWQVRAFTDPISGTPLAFENNGQSRVFTFDIDYPCQAPQHIIATAHTNGIHLTWDASPHPSASYHLSYRRKDFSSTWHQAVTTANSYTISNLTPGANYEYKVGISCTNKTNDIHYSTVAHIAYNPNESETPSTSIQTKVKECGKSRQNNISNTEPKETLWAGDVIYAGDFTITLSTVQGSNGRFTGEGKVHVPYLSGIGMSVYFSDISINTDNQLIEGKIHTVYDESRGTIIDLDAFDHGGTTTPAQGVLVPSYKFDVALTNVTRIHNDPLTNSLIFYDATGSRVGNYELTGTAPSFPVLVSDKEGNMYSINETNKDNPPANYTLVAVGKQIGELAGNAFDRNVVDSHKGTVTFFDAGVGTYSFDEFLPPYDNINYIRYSSENGNERLYPQLGANYYVPWKFIPLNTHDKIQAKISLAPNSELQPERVVFITESGTQVPASYNASTRTYQVSVTGTSNSGVHTLYALYPKGDGTSYFHLGQLRIDSRPPQHLKLVLVYAGGKYDKTAVANELNTIYNRVGIHWQVSEVQNFTYDKETIETLFDKKSGLLSAYNDRMTSLNQALQSHLGDSYQADACYVFMADASQAGTGRDVVGFMPRGRQYGYIYTKGLDQTKIGSILAHELAHGKFKLYHTFDNIYAGKLAQGSTTNLMDYTGGTHLAKWQWNQLYDPAILNGVFDRDEDGEYNIGDLFNWVHEYFFGKNTPTVEKKITRNVISLYDKVYKNYDAYFEQSITQDIDIPTTTNTWSVRQSSHTQDVCKKVFDKVKEKAILSFTFVNRGVYVEEYTLEGKTHKIAIYSYKDRFELLSENITFASLQDLKTNNYIKAAYNSKYGLIFIYGTTGELLMTIQLISDTPLQTTITWLNYLGIVTKSNQQEEDKEIEIKVKELNVTIQTKQKVEEIWDGKKATFPITGKQLYEIFKPTSLERCTEIANIINKYSDKFEINTPLRMSHFLGQIGVETGNLKSLKEIPCYRESSIRANFGYTHYCDLYQGFDCVDLNVCATTTQKVKCKQGKPTKSEKIKSKYICTAELFDYVYSCSARLKDGFYDLGNGSPASKDGSTFLGRGFIQLTGKYNYNELSKAWNKDPENKKNKKYFHIQTKYGGHIDELVTKLDVAMKASMYYWKVRECNKPADKDDTAGVTERVKGSRDKDEVKKRGNIKDKALKVIKPN